MTELEVMSLVSREIKRAEAKHPNWPIDQVYAAAIVSEESGELMRAAVQYELETEEYGGLEKAREHIIEEAVHTATTAIRLLKNI